MELLYNSDAFAVLRLVVPGAGEAADETAAGLEIVDKRGRRDVFLRGALAERFLEGAQALARSGPGDEAEFDDYIAGYAVFGQQTLALH